MVPCQGLLFPVPLAGKMSASKSNHYLSVHLVPFWFWASSLSENITLNGTYKKTDQISSDFQADIGAASHTT